MLNNLTDCEDGDGGASQGKGQPEGVGERRPGAAGPQPRGRGQSRELRGAAEARGGGLRPRRRLLLGGRATPRCGSGRCPRRAPRGCGCAGGAGGPAPAAGGGCGFPRRRPRAEPPPPPARPAPRPQLPQSRGAAGPDRALRGASPRGRGCAPASVPSRAAPGGAAPSRSGRAAAETSATAPSRLPPPALPTRCLSAPPPASPPTLPSRPQPSSLPTPPAAAFGPGPPSPPPPLLAPPPPPPRRPGPALPLSAVLKPCAVQPPGPPRRRAGAADPRGALGLPGRSVRCSKRNPRPRAPRHLAKPSCTGAVPGFPAAGECSILLHGCCWQARERARRMQPCARRVLQYRSDRPHSLQVPSQGLSKAPARRASRGQPGCQLRCEFPAACSRAPGTATHNAFGLCSTA